MEISHRQNVLEGFFKSEEGVMSHMKQFNEYFIFLKESMGNLSMIMVSSILLTKEILCQRNE
jgi:hypothetical protein